MSTEALWKSLEYKIVLCIGAIVIVLVLLLVRNRYQHVEELKARCVRWEQRERIVDENGLQNDFGFLTVEKVNVCMEIGR